MYGTIHGPWPGHPGGYGVTVYTYSSVSLAGGFRRLRVSWSPHRGPVLGRPDPVCVRVARKTTASTIDRATTRRSPVSRAFGPNKNQRFCRRVAGKLEDREVVEELCRRAMTPNGATVTIWALSASADNYSRITRSDAI